MNQAISAKDIQIIEYTPAYAAALADMWNRSSESWGGGTNVRTEDSIRRELENSSNLYNFIAVDGQEVVGFCSFAHYRFDEGALYVPLLNVRPDYHGYKVGRDLILNAVRKTVEAGWPRLDLFTWAGNTKAVPMYKKCGFFWEKNDDYVHLMNFIPTVLQTEALSPYFKELDWYADSTRELVVEPDGRRERGFDFYEYAWRKGELALRAEFEMSGRGLTGLDTPDYSISTEVEDHDLVFGSAYKVRYHIQNHSSSALAIGIQGQSDKNIRFTLDAQRTLAPGEAIVVESKFELEPIQEEQNRMKSHPVVASKWTIGGLEAQFRIGIAPKFPVKMSAALPARRLHLGTPLELYLNAENNYATEAEFTFELPEAEFLEWTQRSVSFTLPPKGKASIPVAFQLHAYGLYSEAMEITATPAGGAPVNFTSKLYALMKGTSGRFGGEDKEQWVAVNGAYSLHLNKTNNDIWMDYPDGGHQFWWVYPKLGRPFSEEFSKRPAEEVKIYADGENQVLEARYISEDFSGVEIKTIAKLQGNGMVEFHHEITNTGGQALEEKLVLLTNFGFFGNRLILPYEGRYLDMGDPNAGESSHWDSNGITENWLFCKDQNVSYGVCWDPSLKLIRPEYPYGLEHPLGSIAAGASVRTKTTVFALNTFTKWWEFRSFAQKLQQRIIPVLEGHLELRIGEGNPFAAGDLTAELIERKMVPLAGEIELYVEHEEGTMHKAASVELNREQDLRSWRAEWPAGEDGTSGNKITASKVRVIYRGEDRVQERSALWYPQSDTDVSLMVEEGPAGSVYTVNNGVLSIAAAPGFGNVVHSLQYQGEEWLDSSYPQPIPHSWWNPWLGGLGIRLPGLSDYSIQQETIRVGWAEREDAYGNLWKGLQITTVIEKQEANRGLSAVQYYLMLPGVPVLCTLHAVTNETGLLQPHYWHQAHNYFKPSAVFSEAWVESPQEGRFILGKADANVKSEGILRMGSASRTNKLHIVNHYPNQSEAAIYFNNKVLSQYAGQSLCIPNGETAWGHPSFIILGKDTLQQEDIQGLLRLTFNNIEIKKESDNADH